MLWAGWWHLVQLLAHRGCLLGIHELRPLGKKWFLKIGRHKYDSALPGKVKNIRKM